MNKDLLRALENLGERKRAISEGSGQTTLIGVMDERGLMMTGTDLTVDEVTQVAERLAKLSIGAILIDDVPPTATMVGLWVDGLLVGLEVARVRSVKPPSSPPLQFTKDELRAIKRDVHNERIIAKIEEQL
jgi:hypothetical protein